MNAGPIIIFSTENLPRLRYIAGLILGDILGLSWEITTDKRKLGKHPVINYSSENVNGAFKISPDPLLFEKGIEARNIITDTWKGMPVFFLTSGDSDFPFDIFAASFYLVTRYEEYCEFQPDEYGRFRATSSFAFKNGFLGVPVVDMWVKEMSKALLKRFQNLAFKRNEYKALLTIDSDEPYAYIGRSLLDSLGGLFHDLKSSTGQVGNRYRIMTKGEKDPYDVYDYILQQIQKYNSDARFFFPVGDHSKYDKNPSWKNVEYRNLINGIADKHNTGLHPSFYASGNSAIMNSEIARMKTILKKEIVSSRFHYIRLFMPRSYQDIADAGIREDFSMGYPDEPGFRAGISRPFYFFNVSEDKQTSLKIIPFQVMDVTLQSYKNLDPAASKEIILKLINETRKSGGLFVSVWHNTSLLDDQAWKGWREVFELMLKTQKP
jgi:hypothetical protein